MSQHIVRRVVSILSTGDLAEMRSPIVARQLAMCNSSLQTRLKTAGTSYRQLLDTERATRAYRALQKDPACSVSDLVDLCGFTDEQSIYRAFPRWFGISLSKVRALAEMNHEIIS